MTEPDLVSILAVFTSFVQNERVKSYNEGLDVERERCLDIVRSLVPGLEHVAAAIEMGATMESTRGVAQIADTGDLPGMGYPSQRIDTATK